MYNPALEKLRNQAEQRLHQKRMQQLEQYKQQTSMRSLFDPLLNVKAREKVGGSNWFETTALGYGELFKNLYGSWKNPGQGLINSLTFVGDTLDYAANLIKAPVLAIAKGEDVGERLADAYGLGDRGRITQNMSELREVIGAPTSGAVGGTLTGAMIGTSISPGWGTLIGAGIGLVAGSVAGAAGYYDVELANTLIDVSLEYASDPLNVVGAIKSGKIAANAAKSAVKSADDIVKASPDVFKNTDLILKGIPAERLRTPAQQAMFEFFTGVRKNIDDKTIKQFITDTMAHNMKNTDDVIFNLKTFKEAYDKAKLDLETLRNTIDAKPEEIIEAAKRFEVAKAGYNHYSKEYKKLRGVHKDWQKEAGISLEKRTSRMVKRYNRLQKTIYKSYYENDFDTFFKSMVEIGIYQDYADISMSQMKHIFKQLNRSANRTIADKFIMFMSKFDDKYTEVVLRLTPPGTTFSLTGQLFKSIKYLKGRLKPWLNASEELDAEWKYVDSETYFKHKQEEQKEKSLLKRALSYPSDSSDGKSVGAIVPYTRGGKYAKDEVIIPEIKKDYESPHYNDELKTKYNDILKELKPKPKPYEPKEYKPSSEFINYSEMNSIERNDLYLNIKQEYYNTPVEDIETRNKKKSEMKSVPLGDHQISTYTFESKMKFIIRKLHNAKRGIDGIEEVAKDSEVVKAFNTAMMFVLYSGEIGQDAFIEFLMHTTYNKYLYKNIETIYGNKEAERYFNKSNNGSTLYILGMLFESIIRTHVKNSATEEYKTVLNELSKKIGSAKMSTYDAEKLVYEKYQELERELTKQFESSLKSAKKSAEEYHMLRTKIAHRNKDAVLESSYALSLQPEIDACAVAESKLAEVKALKIQTIHRFIDGYNKQLDVRPAGYEIQKIDSDKSHQYLEKIKMKKMEKALHPTGIDKIEADILQSIDVIVDEIEEAGNTLLSITHTGEVVFYSNPDSNLAKLYKTIYVAKKELEHSYKFINSFEKSFKDQLDFHAKYNSNADNYIRNLNNIINVLQVVDETISNISKDNKQEIVKAIFKFFMSTTGDRENLLANLNDEIVNIVRKISYMFTNDIRTVITDLQRLEAFPIKNSLASTVLEILNRFKMALDLSSPLHITNIVNRIGDVIIENKKINEVLHKSFEKVFGTYDIYASMQSAIEETFMLYSELGKMLVDAYFKKKPLRSDMIKTQIIKFRNAADNLVSEHAVYSSIMYLEKGSASGIEFKKIQDKTKDVGTVITELKTKSLENNLDPKAIDTINAHIVASLKDRMNSANNNITRDLESTKQLSNNDVNILVNDAISILKYAEVINVIVNDTNFSNLISNYRNRIIKVSHNLINITNDSTINATSLAMINDTYNKLVNYIDNYINSRVSKIDISKNIENTIKSSDTLNTTTASGFSSFFTKYFRQDAVIGYSGLDFIDPTVNAVRLVKRYGEDFKSEILPKDLYWIDPKKSLTVDLETTVGDKKSAVQVAYADKNIQKSLFLFSPEYKRYGYDDLLSEDMVNGNVVNEYNPIGFKEFMANKGKPNNHVTWKDKTGREHVMYENISDLAKQVEDDFKQYIQIDPVTGKQYLVINGQNSANFDSKIIYDLLDNYTDLKLDGIINNDLMYTLRSFTAVGNVNPEGMAKDFKDLTNARLADGYEALVAKGAIEDIAGSAHEASTDVMRTIAMKDKMLGSYDDIQELVDAINAPVKEFNNSYTEKIMEILNGKVKNSIDKKIKRKKAYIKEYKKDLKNLSKEETEANKLDRIEKLKNEIEELKKKVKAYED